MAKSKAPPPPEDDDKGEADAELDRMSALELAAYVDGNPFAHLTHKLIRRLFNIGEKQMRKMMELKPPMVSGKINPAHFQRWLWMKREAIALG